MLKLRNRNFCLDTALKRWRDDICAVHETKWSGLKGSKETANRYKILYYVNPKTDVGVGFIVIWELPRCHCRSVSTRWSPDEVHDSRRFVADPISGNSKKVEDAFSALLDEQATAVPKEDFVIVTDGFNKHVGGKRPTLAAWRFWSREATVMGNESSMTQLPTTSWSLTRD